MATRLAWLLNLDADVELQDPGSYRADALSADRVLALRARMFDLVSDDDVILNDLTRAPTDTGTALAFCPTPSALARINALGLSAPDAPTLDALRRVNHRRFNAELGQTLPRAAFVDDMPTLIAHLATPSPSGSHVIKRAYSFAGRDQRRVHDGVLDDSTRGFCQRSFDRSEGVQVEPWVARTFDCSRHGYVTREGRVLIGDTRMQHVDAMGRFQSMVSDTEAGAIDPTCDAALRDEVQRVGEALFAAGYFGPFGIDGFGYTRDDGTPAFNPRCEINARFTMGYPRALLLSALGLS